MIDGSAFSYPSVARLLSRLGLVPDLSAVTLTNSSSDKGGVAFSITATVKGAPAPPAPVATTPAATGTTATTTSPSA